MWLPLLIASALVLLTATTSAPPYLIAALGIVSRELVDCVREGLVQEVERLRSIGLSIDAACEYHAEKMGISDDALKVMHFRDQMEAAEPPAPQHELESA